MSTTGNRNRCYRWRSRNPEKYRRYQREYMRKRRQKEKKKS